MLGEIIWELTKIKENGTIMSENVLTWAKRVKVQRAQSAVMNSLPKTKEFDKIKVSKMHTRTIPEDTCRQRCPQNRHVDSVVAAIHHPPRQCLTYEKTCTECSKIGHFRAVCRSRRTRDMHEVENKTVQDNDRENYIEPVNISSIQINRNCSILTTNLNSQQVRVIYWYHIKLTQVAMVISCQCMYTKIIS